MGRSDEFHDHDAEAPVPDRIAGDPAFDYPDEEWDPNPFSAIAHNVGKAFGFDELSTDVLEDGEPVVEDEAALEAAERAVAGLDPMEAYVKAEEEWETLLAKRHLSGLFGDAGSTAALVTAPLVSAGIPFAWDPYPPETMPALRAGYGIFDRPFTLMVPKSQLAESKAVMREAYPNLEF